MNSSFALDAEESSLARSENVTPAAQAERYSTGVLSSAVRLYVALTALIGLEHLFGTRLVRGGATGETTTHEEAYIVALALLEPAPAVVVAVALGFAFGGAMTRRGWVKTFFNVGAMTLAAAVAMLAVEALGGGTTQSRTAIL